VKWLVLALLLVGCASEASSAPDPGDDDEDPSSDAAKAEAEKNTDPTGGRDATPSSCFAACQNVAMSCTTKGSAKTSDVFLQLDGFKGCAGTIGAKKLEITCIGDKPQVCIDGACEDDGTFSAFTLGFGDTVCTKSN
jgi:hypothetical protein